MLADDAGYNILLFWSEFTIQYAVAVLEPWFSLDIVPRTTWLAPSKRHCSRSSTLQKALAWLLLLLLVLLPAFRRLCFGLGHNRSSSSNTANRCYVVEGCFLTKARSGLAKGLSMHAPTRWYSIIARGKTRETSFRVVPPIVLVSK